MRAVQVLTQSPHFVVLDTLCSHPRAGCGGLQSGEPAQFVFTRRGSFGLHVGARSYFARPGTAVLLRADVDFRVSHPAWLGHDCCTNILIGPDLFDELIGNADASPGWEFRHDLNFQKAHLEAAVGLRRQGSELLDVEESLLELLSCLLRLQRMDSEIRMPRTAHARRGVQRVQQEILGRVEENLSIDDLAKVAGCSPYHLCRVFRQETGQSLRQFRLQQRLGTALGRLSEGDEDLAAIACDLGFSSHSHMTEAFRQALGVSPHALRDDMKHADLSRMKARLQTLSTAVSRPG